MRRVFVIPRTTRWVIVLSMILTIFSGTGLALALSLQFSKTSMAQAETVANSVQLASPVQIDQQAQAEYLQKLEAEKQAKIEQQKQQELIQQQAQTQAQAATKTQTVSRPVVAAPATDRLIIPSIGLNAQLVTVGLTAQGAVDVNPNLPGRWNGSAQPGSAGAVFVDGHKEGIFRDLGALAVGSQVTISLSSGANYNYTVRATEVVELSKVDMSKALHPFGGAMEGLNLMTCAGAWTGSTYSHRLIVYATR